MSTIKAMSAHLRDLLQWTISTSLSIWPMMPYRRGLLTMGSSRKGIKFRGGNFRSGWKRKGIFSSGRALLEIIKGSVGIFFRVSGILLRKSILNIIRSIYCRRRRRFRSWILRSRFRWNKVKRERVKRAKYTSKSSALISSSINRWKPGW